VDNFPSDGVRTIVEWQESKQNFSIVGSDTNHPEISGAYMGGQQVTESGCPGGDISFYEWATWDISVASGGAATIFAQDQTTGTWTLHGTLFHDLDGGQFTIIASPNESAGTIASASFVIPSIYVTPHGLTFEFVQQAVYEKNGAQKTCTISGRAGGVRC